MLAQTPSRPTWARSSRLSGGCREHERNLPRPRGPVLDEWVVQVLRTSYSAEDTPVHALETVCAATRPLFPIGQVACAGEF